MIVTGTEKVGEQWSHRSRTEKQPTGHGKSILHTGRCQGLDRAHARAQPFVSDFNSPLNPTVQSGKSRTIPLLGFVLLGQKSSWVWRAGAQRDPVTQTRCQVLANMDIFLGAGAAGPPWGTGCHHGSGVHTGPPFAGTSTCAHHQDSFSFQGSRQVGGYPFLSLVRHDTAIIGHQVAGPGHLA